MFKLHHRGFPKYLLALPIDWTVDPFSNKNWRHHLVSLRWLKQVPDAGKRYKILKDFHRFHIIDRTRNPYYSELRGDHTMAIRSGELAVLLNDFETAAHADGQQICRMLLRQEIANMLDPKVYRSGHNHGLMIDMALLRTGLVGSEFAELVPFDSLQTRAIATLNKMFDKEGITREHSISYQMYNAGLACELADLFDEIGVGDKSLSDLIEKIRNSTKKLLEFFIKEDGQCFPIGDSHRHPLVPQLQRVFGYNDPDAMEQAIDEIVRWPENAASVFYSDSGFIAGKFARQGFGKLHLVFTCSWHSQIHKQNDEFAFCLSFNGKTIIDEVGYTSLVPHKQMLEHRHEGLHSNFSLIGENWSDVRSCDGSSRIIDCTHDDDSLQFSAEHHRIPGFRARRQISYDKQSTLFLHDRLEKRDGHVFSGQIEHRFVLSPYAQCIVDDNHVKITLDDVEVEIRADGNGEWLMREVDYVPPERRALEKTTILAFRYPIARSSVGEVAFRFDLSERGSC